MQMRNGNIKKLATRNINGGRTRVVSAPLQIKLVMDARLLATTVTFSIN